MLAVSRVALTNVVGRGAPAQSTAAPGANFVPSTVIVKLGSPDIAPSGVSAISVGAVAAGSVIGKAWPKLCRPSAFRTVIHSAPGAAISTAGKFVATPRSPLAGGGPVYAS